MREFTGKESAADIVRIAIDAFSKSPLALTMPSSFKIIYPHGIPHLVHHKKVNNDWGDYVVQYRLDKMLLTLYPECERIVDEAKQPELLGSDAHPRRREEAINHIAFYAMITMLTYLIVKQVDLFEENFTDTVALTSSAFLIMLAYTKPYDKEKSIKAANDRVRTMLTSRAEEYSKKKRETLVEFIKIHPKLGIPLGVGRPAGSTKPAEQKAQEAAEFEQQIEETIRQLLSAKGEMPTKTAVAKAIGIGGLSAGGNDTSLQAFRNKLERFNIDYKAIVERVRLNK